mgnify:CR=1 FL=1
MGFGYAAYFLYGYNINKKQYVIVSVGFCCGAGQLKVANLLGVWIISGCQYEFESFF